MKLRRSLVTRMGWLLHFFFVVGLHASSPALPASPRAITPQGELEGIYRETRNGVKYAKFLGVPYAKFPGRFRVASEFVSWKGVRPAKEFGAMCAQVDLFLGAPFKGIEDCLFLNVFTANLKENGEVKDAKNLLPVYFYIHGGGLLSGAGDFYDGKYLLDEGMVMVTFNYRLGPFGFFTFNTGSPHDIPGNLGLKDQQLALRWVQKNIRAFGGDPAKVTLGGFSSGASSSHYHVISPTSAGLFRGMIGRGGTALSFWATQRRPRRNANKFAKLVGCPTLKEKNDNIKGVVQCFRDRPVQQLTELQLKLREWHEYPFMPFAAVIEPNSTTGAFVTEPPLKILEEGRYTPVPLLLSMNREEANLMAYPVVANQGRLEHLSQNWEAVAPIMYDYRHLGRDDKKEASQLLKQVYVPHGGVGNDSVLRLMLDRYFLEPLDTSVRLHSRQGPVYPLIVCHRPPFSLMNAVFKEAGFHGVVHGDALQYLFPGGTAGAPDYSKDSPYKSDLEFSQKFAQLLGGFIREGKPSLWDGKIWEPARSGQPVEYHALDNELSTYTEPDLVSRLDAYRKALVKADGCPY